VVIGEFNTVYRCKREHKQKGNKMKRISEDIKEAKEQVVNAVLNSENTDKVKRELEELLHIASAQDVLVHQVVKHYKDKETPTESELHNKIESLLDNAPESFLEYRKEVYNKVRSRVEFRMEVKNLKRGECYYG
jgi:DNA-binding GntR family transcriptional regulator